MINSQYPLMHTCTEGNVEYTFSITIGNELVAVDPQIADVLVQQLFLSSATKLISNNDFYQNVNTQTDTTLLEITFTGNEIDLKALGSQVASNHQAVQDVQTYMKQDGYALIQSIFPPSQNLCAPSSLLVIQKHRRFHLPSFDFSETRSKISSMYETFCNWWANLKWPNFNCRVAPRKKHIYRTSTSLKNINTTEIEDTLNRFFTNIHDLYHAQDQEQMDELFSNTSDKWVEDWAEKEEEIKQDAQKFINIHTDNADRTAILKALFSATIPSAAIDLAKELALYTFNLLSTGDDTTDEQLFTLIQQLEKTANTSQKNQFLIGVIQKTNIKLLKHIDDLDYTAFQTDFPKTCKKTTLKHMLSKLINISIDNNQQKQKAINIATLIIQKLRDEHQRTTSKQIYKMGCKASLKMKKLDPQMNAEQIEYLRQLSLYLKDFHPRRNSLNRLLDVK